MWDVSMCFLPFQILAAARSKRFSPTAIHHEMPIFSKITNSIAFKTLLENREIVFMIKTKKNDLAQSINKSPLSHLSE